MNPIQSFSSGVLAEIIRRQPASKGKTTFAWQLAVGPAVARATTVELRDGVLVVAAKDGNWIREVARNQKVILERMRTLLGADAVERINLSP
jgi:predicted nucleic acid-binding Zn ribbon protein